MSAPLCSECGGPLHFAGKGRHRLACSPPCAAKRHARLEAERRAALKTNRFRGTRWLRLEQAALRLAWAKRKRAADVAAAEEALRSAADMFRRDRAA